MAPASRISGRGAISRIQRFSTHDGPGIRTTVFLKGCPLNCSWCHNPETIAADAEILFFQERCQVCGACVPACPEGAHSISHAGGHVFDRTLCTHHRACIEVCPFGALETSLTWMVAEEVLNVVSRDVAYYRNSGGGITVSGGEPLQQPEFTGVLLDGARSRGVHTAVDTSLHGSWQTVVAMSPLVDLWLVDVKMIDSEKHRRYTGVGNTRILENLRRLTTEVDTQVWIRIPLVDDVNTDESDLKAMVEFIKGLKNIAAVGLLPYHSLGVVKRLGLGEDPVGPFSAPDTELVQNLALRLRREDIEVHP